MCGHLYSAPTSVIHLNKVVSGINETINRSFCQPMFSASSEPETPFSQTSASSSACRSTPSLAFHEPPSTSLSPGTASPFCPPSCALWRLASGSALLLIFPYRLAAAWELTPSPFALFIFSSAVSPSRLFRKEASARVFWGQS